MTTQQATYNKLDFLKLMYLSREGDRREGVLLRQSKGWFQVAGMGHETLAVISSHLREDDYLFPYYRDRAFVLSRGVTTKQLAEAYFAKRVGSSGGRQMPGHYSSREKNVWSVPTPTGANLLPACGAAWNFLMDGKDSVAIATIGDAASRQGEFYEAVAFAVERKLPVIFIVEDNRYGISTNTDKFNPFKLGIFGDGCNIMHVDARHPDRVYDSSGAAVERARKGEGPTVMVCELDRLCSHTSSDDHRTYRPEEEIAEMADRDPINVMAAELIEAGELTEKEWEEFKETTNREVDQCYIDAESEQDPKADELLFEQFGEDPVPATVPLEGGKPWRMVDAINQVFRAGLKENKDYVFFGEDIEDPKGGVFRLTSGLSENHPDRAFNSPLAEATIAGVGCGMASTGKHPVFEIQFIDFHGPAWNQISQNISTLRWRTFGDWKCPMVLYAPYGAYLPGGSLWHSQANEAFFAHIPGIRVVIPSTPEDAAALMWTAMHSENPVVYLVPKHLFRQNMPVAEVVEPVPFGKARIRREGADVTLVCWGNATEIALDAAKKLEGELDVEVVDLRTIQPWDKETVRQSVEKTGRLVVVQEDGESCSVGQMVISEMVGGEDSFSNFLAAPRLVSKPDVYIGYNPIYEYGCLPMSDDVIEVLREVNEE